MSDSSGQSVIDLLESKPWFRTEEIGGHLHWFYDGDIPKHELSYFIHEVALIVYNSQTVNEKEEQR